MGHRNRVTAGAGIMNLCKSSEYWLNILSSVVKSHRKFRHSLCMTRGRNHREDRDREQICEKSAVVTPAGVSGVPEGLEKSFVTRPVKFGEGRNTKIRRHTYSYR